MEVVVNEIIMEKRMIKAFRYVVACAMLCVVVACGRTGVVFDDTVRLSHPTWHRDSVVSFDVNIEDTTLVYESGILVRNSGDYDYQNIWLFVTEIAPDSTCRRDTIQYYLADNYGRWLGSGIGSLYTNLYYYKEEVRYSQVGTYTYIIEQAMREDDLRGIANIGLQIIEKNGKE